ncbi:MAG TPA: L-ribulose-5-phosphate 4-epimerase AraD [Verrucomicrobiales bacterium]|nr:L-ribulose-5-phosphate 4-epimerase AraD [Verrucomicrobiales bacterium]
MLASLREEVAAANRRLVAEGLVTLTWGNVSGIDRAQGIFAIKPSGIPYAELSAESIVLVDLEGKVVQGDLRPSSDAPTHRVLYLAFDAIGGITHTHSPFATMFAQAGRALPCLGTTHADHFLGPVPLCRALTPEEVREDYETNTGKVIAAEFAGRDPLSMPAVLQHYHAPFTWGGSAMESVDNSVALEACARLAAGSWRLGLDPLSSGLPSHLLEKHFFRKHGCAAYYGQK